MAQQKSDMLLIVVPPWDYEKPSLGVAYLATYLKSKGASVEIMDINIELYLKSTDTVKNNWINQASFFWLQKEVIDKYTKEIEDIAERILSYESKVLGFSVNTANSIYFLKELLLRIRKKESDKIIVVGGPGCFFPHERQIFLGNLVDFFIIGKGEVALEWLLRKMGIIDYSKIDEKRITVKKENDYLCVEGVQGFSLDTLPLPTFEEFDLNLYTRPVLPILWSEGCIRSCAFCLDKIFSGAYRPSSALRIINGIKFYIEKYKVRNFRFVDNLINGNLQYLDEFCDYLIKENILIDWGGQIVVRADMAKPIFEKMKAAKCNRLELGVESFSDRVLCVMKKGFRAQEAIRNIIDAKTSGLNVSIFIIIGFPGETEMDFEKTIKNIKKYREYIDEVGNLTLCCIPFGTDLYNNPQNYNIASEGPKVLKEFWLKWHTKDNSNNFEVRSKRLKRLTGVFYELQIPFQDNMKLVA